MDRILVVATFALFLLAIGRILHRIQPQFLADLIASIKTRTANAKSSCPYCREAFGASDEIVRCATCNSGHHAICWTQSSGCTVFGCSGRRSG